MDTSAKTIALIVLAVLVDGLAGLAGGLIPSTFVQKHIATLLAFAAGTLVGSVFLDMLPDALSQHPVPSTVLNFALTGFLLFYAIESIFGSHATGQSGHKHSADHHEVLGPMILLGDALHNISDGVAIASAFMVNTHTGIITSLAVVVHELPQEVGDYSILVTHGYSRARALTMLGIVQLSALVGALGAVWLSSHIVNASYCTLALSAGGFLYVASADLLPELKKQRHKSGWPSRLMAFCVGISAIAMIEHLI